MRNLKWIAGGVLIALIALIAAGVWWYRPGGVEAALLAEEPYRILKRHDQADYSRILSAWKDFQAGGRSQSEFIRESNAVFSQVATRRLGTASQDSMLALMHDTIRTVKKLRATSPETCFRYFYPEIAGAPDVAGILDAGEQRRTLALMGEVVRNSAESPAARPAEQEVEQALTEVINATYEQFGTDAQMVAHPEDPRIDRGKVCDITIALYERILALPPDMSVQLIRYMAPASAAS
jgi:hypothetical protein